jgi:hypothetical protein
MKICDKRFESFPSTPQFKPTHDTETKVIRSSEGCKRVLKMVFVGNITQEIHFDEIEELERQDLQLHQGMPESAAVYRYYLGGDSCFSEGVYEEYPNFLPRLRKLQKPHIEVLRKSRQEAAEVEKENRKKRREAQAKPTARPPQLAPPEPPEEQKPYTLSDLPVFEYRYYGARREFYPDGLLHVYEPMEKEWQHIPALVMVFQTSSVLRWNTSGGHLEPVQKKLKDLVEIAKSKGAQYILRGPKKANYFFFACENPTGIPLWLGKHSVQNLEKRLA